MTDEEIRKKGMEALSNALGPAGVARFLKVFDRGQGDWTEERAEMLSDDVRAIAVRIQRRSKGGSTGGHEG